MKKRDAEAAASEEREAKNRDGRIVATRKVEQGRFGTSTYNIVMVKSLSFPNGWALVLKADGHPLGHPIEDSKENRAHIFKELKGVTGSADESGSDVDEWGDYPT